jgi:dienelactone hydrolase
MEKMRMLFERSARIAGALLVCTTAAMAEPTIQNIPAAAYVSFPSPDLLNPDAPLTVSGQLRIPPEYTIDAGASGSLHPAVVILHGSAGLDSRGGFYVDALNKAGVATLEIDMWAARGLAGGDERPGLPTVTVPDAFSAMKFLAEHPAIDPDRIGLLGFSWGGVVTMLAATKHYTDLYGEGRSFAAYASHYPVCWAYNAGIPGVFFDGLTGNPVLIQVGDQDGYDDGSLPCQLLAQPFPNVSVNVYENAYHAWDRLEPALAVTDPFSHRGRGGVVALVPNPDKAVEARDNVLAFFRSTLDN